MSTSRAARYALISVSAVVLLVSGVFVGLWLAYNYAQESLLNSVVLETRAEQNALNIRLIMEDEEHLWNGLINEFNLIVLSLQSELRTSNDIDMVRICRILHKLDRLEADINDYQNKNPEIKLTLTKIQNPLVEGSKCLLER